MAFNVLCGGTRLQDIEGLRNDAAYMDTLGAEMIPSPTAAGDFTRRLGEGGRGAGGEGLEAPTYVSIAAIESTASGARFGTVTEKLRMAERPPGSVAVTVTVALPCLSPITRTFSRVALLLIDQLRPVTVGASSSSVPTRCTNGRCGLSSGAAIHASSANEPRAAKCPLVAPARGFSPSHSLPARASDYRLSAHTVYARELFSVSFHILSFRVDFEVVEENPFLLLLREVESQADFRHSCRCPCRKSVPVDLVALN